MKHVFPRLLWVLAVTVTAAADASDRTAAQKPDDNVSSRSLFTSALARCEAKTNLDRVPRLLEVGAAMQDRDPQSNTYGNFRWYWREKTIRDRNAVDFCMMGGSLLWIRHRDALTPAARKTLRETLEYGVEGCLRHRVRTSYTNIALMNALDLILLGEGLGKPDVADEGYKRLDRVCLYTWQWGTHEYCSPTYYGVDLECLLLIEAFCKRQRGRDQARALLELFWTDIALNWYDPSQRLSGACSRDYQYLLGTGHLNTYMRQAGWLPGSGGSVFGALGRWKPPERLRELNRTRYPRLVRQSWGIPLSASRTSYVCRDVVLGSAGAHYGPMDLPLTVDLPGGRGRPRCYFIPDGRGDPYGKKRIDAGAHRKAQHLRPFWTAAQDRFDAVGLVVYRPVHLRGTFTTLESHFVMRRDVDGFWIGDRRVDLSGTTPVSHDVPAGKAVVLREGTAAVGVRVPWARKLDGTPAAAKLVYDGNKHGAVRLTVGHHVPGRAISNTDEDWATYPGAAFWVRIGSDLKTDQSFETWRRAFAAAKARVRVQPKGIRVEAVGKDGPIVVAGKSPYHGAETLVPTPSRAVLELDGKDIGREILKQIQPIADYRDRQGKLAAVVVRPEGGTYLEAESGFVMPEMVVATDASVSGGRYVWTSGKPGERGMGDGYVLWKLRVVQPGTYTIWGRILAPTPDDDSFHVRALTERSELVGLAAWHTGVHKTWAWTPMHLNRGRRPTRLTLPAGILHLELRTREDGTKIDRLFITDDPSARPH